MTHFLAILSEMRSDPLARFWARRLLLALPFLAVMLVLWALGWVE